MSLLEYNGTRRCPKISINNAEAVCQLLEGTFVLDTIDLQYREPYSLLTHFLIVHKYIEYAPNNFQYNVLKPFAFNVDTTVLNFAPASEGHYNNHINDFPMTKFRGFSDMIRMLSMEQKTDKTFAVDYGLND